LRFLFTGGLHALDLGRPETARNYGEAAAKAGARLTDWQRDLLGTQLARLRRIAVWQPLLD
ncbi:MAG: hypothetical protein KAI24_18430, partial [Planctomycetes bacterium]|nr:hypothetical protein [Planctomycetota bacterium]